MIERVGPLHAQGVESTYVNLWSRIEGIRRDQLTRALGRRAVARGNVQRNTLHLHSAREYPLYHAALRTPRLDWLAGSWKHRYSDAAAAAGRADTREGDGGGAATCGGADRGRSGATAGC